MSKACPTRPLQKQSGTVYFRNSSNDRVVFTSFFGFSQNFLQFCGICDYALFILGQSDPRHSWNIRK